MQLMNILACSKEEKVITIFLNKKNYLPEELNIKKMYDLYSEKYKGFPVSYETYRTKFTTEHNISFRYPRKTHVAHVIHYLLK